MKTASIRRLSRLMTAILASLAIASCSKPATQAATDAAPAPPPPSTAAAMDHAAMGTADADKPMDPNVPMAMATVATSGAFGSGKPVSVTLHVTDMMSGKPMGPDSFSVAHTQKLHVLGVDPSLVDYSHSHPVASATPGDWNFEFTPRFNRPYHLWLDVTPVGGTQQFVLVSVNEQGQPAAVDKTQSLTASVGDITAVLSFDAPLAAGKAAMGHLQVQRGGKPFSALEPVMGAYSHIVGISEDWTTIAHVHPMGPEPTQATERGGPDIDFHLEPRKAGFLKIFAQIQVDGRSVFLPFGSNVAQSSETHSDH